jgi:uncharacterized protein YcbK (DUF882 family)
MIGAMTVWRSSAIHLLGKTPVCAARRRFLVRASVACGAFGALAGLPGRAATAGEPRSLRFVHTHTGEKLTAPYFDGSSYSEACLGNVNQLLRDWRTGEIHPIDPRLLDVLYDLQALTGRDATYEVICGYRSPATNAMLRRNSSGVAEHSQHLLGKAIDVRLTGYPSATLAEQARTLSRGGVGYYEKHDFIHVDTGRVRFW